MKISVIGAGNVGSQTAMRIAQEGMGNVVLVDILKGLAQGKALDLEDCRWILKNHYDIQGTEDIAQIKDSDIVVVTAGLARKPGMTREELLKKNSEILKGICSKIKELAKNSIVIIVTNPLDLMTYFALKATGFNSKRIIGMGISLDTARFSNLISNELNIPCTDIEARVIGSHGEKMLPLPRFCSIKGVPLEQFLDEEKIKSLVEKTIGRGLEIVTLLGSGSAFFAPSAAIAEIVKAIAKDEKKTIGVCVYLDGEYAIKDVCIGVPCRIGSKGIEDIIELDLSKDEREALLKSAAYLKKQFNNLTI